MKNKKAILIAAIFLFSLRVFAQDFKFNFEPTVGFLYGTIIENVWNADIKVSGNTTTCTPTTRLSMLDWQLHNAVYTGARFDLDFFEKVNFTFDFITAISGPYGTMEDYDWKETSKPDHLTNYSYHTNIINSYTQINLLMGHTFIPGNQDIFSITPKFGLHIQNFDFAGKGGFKFYESDNWEPHSFPQESYVITYSQSFCAPNLVVDMQINPWEIFYTNLTLGISYINKLDGRDNHIERGLYFNDRIESAWLLQGELKLMFKMGSCNKLGLKGSVQFIPNAYGFTYYSDKSWDELSQKPDLSGLGGTARLMFTYALVYSFYF